MEQINNKVERYINLSKKFSKTGQEIFGLAYESNTGVCTSVLDFTAVYSQQQSVVVKEKTRAEKIREAAETQAKLAEYYDEYLQLQKELSDYFTSLNKLTK